MKWNNETNGEGKLTFVLHIRVCFKSCRRRREERWLLWWEELRKRPWLRFSEEHLGPLMFPCSGICPHLALCCCFLPHPINTQQKKHKWKRMAAEQSYLIAAPCNLSHSRYHYCIYFQPNLFIFSGLLSVQLPPLLSFLMLANICLSLFFILCFFLSASVFVHNLLDLLLPCLLWSALLWGTSLC